MPNCLRLSSPSLLLGLILLALSSSHVVHSALTGDEHYLNVTEGYFWAFYDGGIALIDPETCAINVTITTDKNGSALPSSWNHGLYMQHSSSHSTSQQGTTEGQKTTGHKKQRRVHYKGAEGYVLINSGDNATSNVTGEPVSKVYVLSTTHNNVKAIVEVGPGAVQAYGISALHQFWTHSEDDGHFYVIQLPVSANSTAEKTNLQYSGKLLWGESSSLGNRGFATSKQEHILFELNLENKTQVAAFDYSTFLDTGATTSTKTVSGGGNSSACIGLDSIAFSAVNQHVYAECTGTAGGILEFDVSNNKIAFVQHHAQVSGDLYEVPDGSFVTAVNKNGQTVQVLVPQGTGKPSLVQVNMSVPGHPDSIAYVPQNNSGAHYYACMPLVDNVNSNQRYANGTVACDFFNGCAGAVTADDVAHGICLYDANKTGALQTVTGAINATEMPHCARCADTTNFDIDGTCTCTPNCGACDRNAVFDANFSGVACFDLTHALSMSSSSSSSMPEHNTATLIANSGAVLQASAAASATTTGSSAASCSYGETHRSQTRGSKWDATVTNFPFHAITILDVENFRVQCEARLPGAPSQVLYVPTHPIVPDDGGNDDEKPTTTPSSSPGLFRVSALVCAIAVGIVGFPEALGGFF